MASARKARGAEPGHRHLSPLEVQSIAGALDHGERAADLATLHGVSRQTIYNSLRAAREGLLLEFGDGGAPPAKRRRAKRLTPEVESGIAEMKRKYPSWGVDYLREQWKRSGHASLSRTSIYRILREAGLQGRRVPAGASFQRFEMTRPGQLWQADIQGKAYLPGVGWVHGFEVLDDYSRFCPAFRYFSDMRLSNAILVLNEAIERYGVPEAVYVDNGSQFKSRGERLNNFELFCAAYAIKVVTSTPYRPQGKGKLERFNDTMESQFLAEARVAAQADPNYSLTDLNRAASAWLRDIYHVRVHGGTKEAPAERFASGRLRAPDPPVDVAKFLERTTARRVNKYGEVSYCGYKIQVDIPSGAKVTVVDTLETVRVEYGSGLAREVNKQELSKDAPVKRQDGVGDHAPEVAFPDAGEASSVKKRIKGRHSHPHAADDSGYYHRQVNPKGIVKVNGISYYVGERLGGTGVLLKVVGNFLLVHDEAQQRLCRIEVRRGRRY